jgi:hypothetical protein
MTESEIVYQISEAYNRSWSIQQWWASISVGLLILSTVAAEKLNFVIITVVVSLYSAFSFNLFMILTVINKVTSSYVSDLHALADSGHMLASGSFAYTEPGSEIGVALTLVALFGTYLGCVTYFIYSFYKNKREINA